MESDTSNAALKSFPAWKDFVNHYTENGASQSKAQDAALLEDLIDNDITPQAFIAKNRAIGFAELKRSLDNICAAQSDKAGEKGPSRDLNDYITGRLISRWIALLTENRLYPPPESPSVSNAVKEKRDDIRRQEPGGLLASVILSTCSSTIGGGTKRAKGKLRNAQGIDIDKVSGASIKVFDNTLFVFNDDKGPQDLSSGARFKNYLYGRITAIAARNALISQKGAVSLDKETGGNDERTGHERFQDYKAPDPTRQAENNDQFALIMHIITQELNEQEQEVIKRRFGLNSDRIAHTPVEVAQELGISTEKVRQIETRAMRLVRAHAHEKIPDEEVVSARSLHTPSQEVPSFLLPTPLKTSDHPDYPYASLEPTAAALLESGDTRMKAIEMRHISDMLKAGMPTKWSAKPSFYNDVRTQWQEILDARKIIATTSIIADREIGETAIKLLRALINNAPDAGHASQILMSRKKDASDGLSYNALYKRFGHIDFRQPSKVAEALVYDPRWRDEVIAHLAHVPTQLMAEQVRDVYKPDHFDPTASFGECLEAYVGCGGKTFDKFLVLYCAAKGHEKDWRGKHIVSPDMFAKELNQGESSGQVIDRQTISFWIRPTSHEKPAQLTGRHRDIVSTRYSLTEYQRRCLDFINRAITTLDSVENIIDREELKIKNDPSPDTYSCAVAIFTGLLGAQPDLSPERLSKKIGGAIAATKIQAYVKHNKVNLAKLMTCVDKVACVLVPNDPKLARRAENLMLGLPSSREMSFRESITFARTQGYTIAEFFDMRRYQLRDQIKSHWQATHTTEKFDGTRAFREFILAEIPAGIPLTVVSLIQMRVSTEDCQTLPKVAGVNFLARKLGAENKEDIIAFRQLVYAHPLDAGHNKVETDLEALEQAGDDREKRREAVKKILQDIQERDGLRYRSDLAEEMFAHAQKTGIIIPDGTTADTFGNILNQLGKNNDRTSLVKAQIIAAYVFSDDPDRQKRLRNIITTTRQIGVNGRPVAAREDAGTEGHAAGIEHKPIAPDSDHIRKRTGRRREE
jgi:RNA polymerase sigma factor (sigma-70 family)